MENLIKKVIECAYKVHLALPPGFKEKVYQRALMIELKENGIEAQQEQYYDAKYRGEIVGKFRIDILIEKNLIIELKAVDNIIPTHGVQLVNYLNMANIDNGLILNFGSDKFQVQRKFRLRKT